MGCREENVKPWANLNTDSKATTRGNSYKWRCDPWCWQPGTFEFKARNENFVFHLCLISIWISSWPRAMNGHCKDYRPRLSYAGWIVNLHNVVNLLPFLVVCS
jgi:hypothetical protein